jgi:hypothetical protein
LCHDVDRDRFVADVYPRYVLTSISSLSAPSAAPDPSHPASYIICEQDRAVPPQAQEAMANAADHVHRLPSSSDVRQSGVRIPVSVSLLT